ncbi:hypothetical protein PHYBOEH_005773 [Phytophthora boehmeriae]|uniref:J domain-containing protein n=1 Tax=Phytophthora boehmeriae TaxID=109152 RepID=A0A8T1XFW1_9STRA|nr:hypothetical protein PHYBOEH_005773 [Phytophthora boehmeriae]
MAPHESDSQQHAEAPAWWWRGASARQGCTRAVTSNETELLSAAVLCAALSATKASPSASDPIANARAARELEMHVRKSPLPHTLQLPVLEFTTDYVLTESEGAVICAVHATKASDIVQAVAGSAVPLSQPFVHRFGGARVHASFWKRAQKLELSAVYQQARQRNKMLLLCGHSIGGSIAKLAFCELVYSSLPKNMRAQLEKIDAKQPDVDKKEHKHKSKRKDNEKKHGKHSEWLREARDGDRVAAFRDLPMAMAVGFGAPYVGNDVLTTFLEVLGMQDRIITFVNEFDCIPSILNIAHSAAMLAKTTERLVTIAKATKALLNLLPAPVQQRIADMTKTAGAAAAPSATSAYLSMSITMLQKSFDKLREFNIVKVTDYRYAPCGSYVFMTKENSEFNIYSDHSQIRKTLGEDGDEATSSLTGNSILQHMMTAYVDAITRRSRSVQINSTMNHYERLGVARNASEREIRRSYRSLALRWHPDRVAHGSLTDQQKEAAEDVFKLLAESYEVLSSPEYRRTYDAHLNRPPSRREEFMHYGTVDGVTLDEAISIFSDAVENFSSTLHRVSGRLTSSSATTVGHPLQHNGGKLSTTSASPSHMAPANGAHITSKGAPISSDGTSTGVAVAPDSSNPLSASIPAGGTAASSSTISISEAPASFSKTGEIVTSNKADTTTQVIDTRSSSGSISSKSTSTSLKTVSVVGGAVAVAASVAIIVSAWSQFSEASRKKRQAAAVRDMSGDGLVLLLEDCKHVQQRQIRTPSIEQLQQSRARQIKAFAIASTPNESKTGSESQLAKEAQQALIELTQEDDEKDQEDRLIDEFFECTAQDEEAAIEALVEEEFFDCVELVQDVDQHFTARHAKLFHRDGHGMSKVAVIFPRGSRVNTPFGLGVVEDWRDNTPTAAIRFESPEVCLRYVNKKDITRGAALAHEEASNTVTQKRAELAERVIVNYGLEENKTGDQIASVALAGAEGAVDSGLRAAGGVVLVNGMARSGTAMGGMVAAPLAIASILVDIGKEFYDYRKKHTERKSLGVLSSTILPGEEDGLESVNATVEALVHSQHLTAGQAFSLYSQLDSKDIVQEVAAREIIAALQFELDDSQPEAEKVEDCEDLFPAFKGAAKIEQVEDYQELFPTAKVKAKIDEVHLGRIDEEKEAPLVAVNAKSAVVVMKTSSTLNSSEPRKKGSKPAQVDPRLDVMCSLMSTEGLQQFLAAQGIVPEDGKITSHQDLHCLALASAVPPASSSSRSEK